MSQLFHLNESNNRSDCSKLSIIDYLIQNGNSTTADMARVLGVSMPTAAKLISELCDDGYVNEYGKLETDEGRRPLDSMASTQAQPTSLASTSTRMSSTSDSSTSVAV